MTQTPGMPSGVCTIIPDRRRRIEKARNSRVPTVASGEGLTALLSKTNGLSRGTWKGAHLPGTLKDGRRRALETERLSVKGEPGGTAPLLGTPNDMLSNALEMGVCFHRGPVLGNMGGGASFLGPSRKG